MTLLSNVINWFLFRRYANIPDGPHLSNIEFLLTSALFIFVFVVYARKNYWSKLSEFKQFAYIIILGGFTILLPLCFEEAVFEFIWVSANLFYVPSTYHSISILWNNNIDAWRTYTLSEMIFTICIMLHFWREFKPKLVYWAPWILTYFIWFFVFKLEVSLPFGSGYPYWSETSYIANGFEVFEVLTFCIALTLSFYPKGINMSIVESLAKRGDILNFKERLLNYQRKLRNKQGVSMLEKIILLAIGLFVLAFILPPALTAIATSALTSVNSAVVTLFQILVPIIAVVGVVLLVYHETKSGGE